MKRLSKANDFKQFPTKEFKSTFNNMVEFHLRIEDNMRSWSLRKEGLSRVITTAAVHCTDITQIGAFVSSDSRIAFKSYTQNTQPVLSVLFVRNEITQRYRAYILEDEGYMYIYNRFNLIDINGNRGYLLNVEEPMVSMSPLLFVIENGHPVKYSYLQSNGWEKFCLQYKEGMHMDFNPRTLTWSLCKKSKNGFWKAIQELGKAQMIVGVKTVSMICY